MPAYSFKERFVPMVLDGTKPHTIRKRRAKGFAKTGDKLYLYYALRTKYCKKLREEICTNVRTIRIDKVNERFIVLLFHRRLTDQEITDGTIWDHNGKGAELLEKDKLDLFAWTDGFRPDGSHHHSPAGAFELMMRWWDNTHDLPFIGDVIYWNPSTI